MNALTWTRNHLPHPHRNHAEPAATAAHHNRRTTVIGAVVAAYLSTVALLVTVAGGLFGMSARESWGFALGVASYVLLFGAVLGGMIWAVANNQMDDPSRR